MKGGGRTCQLRRRKSGNLDLHRAGCRPENPDTHKVQTPSSSMVERGRRVTKRPRKEDRRGVSESRREVKGKTERDEPRHAGKEWDGDMGEGESKTRSLLLERPRTTGRTARWRGHHTNHHTSFFSGCDHPPPPHTKDETMHKRRFSNGVLRALHDETTSCSRAMIDGQVSD